MQGEILPADVEPFILDQPSKGGSAPFFSIQAQRGWYAKLKT